MTPRARLVALAVVAVLLVAGAAAYLTRQHRLLDARSRSGSRLAVADLDAVRSGPHLVFRSSVRDGTYGRVAMVALADPGGARAVTGTACERVDATRTRVLCLSADRGVSLTYRAQVLDAALHPVRDLDLSGVASRARLSDDGTLAATTTFVAGHSYAASTFSTQTLVTPVSGPSYGDLERFRLVHDGRAIRPVDRNVWGVTFAGDDDTFYATVAWGGHTWLSRGSLSRRELVTLRPDAECPALSPDGTRVVYKKRQGRPAGQWGLAVYDLRTGRETALAEPRSVDDQLEWLDDRTVLYGLPRRTAGDVVSDVWALPADGTGAPRVFVEGAWSPSVVR